MKRILLKSFIFYMLLAQALMNVAYARHVCVMADDSPSSSHSISADAHMPDTHAPQQVHEHVDDCVCAGDHQHCSASPSITFNADINVASLHVHTVAMTADSHPFPAHLVDRVRPPSLSC